MGQTQITNLMSEMKLDGMLASFSDTISIAAKNEWSYSEVIDALLQAEKEHRNNKRTARLILNSKLKMRAALEDIDFTAKRSVTKGQIKELYSLSWLEQGRPILIIGPTGVGKTFIAQALGHHACRRRITTFFMTFANLLEHQALSRASGTYLRFKDKLIFPKLLILDDFGLRKLNAIQAHDFCEILEDRSIDKSTIITSQLTLDRYSEVIEDPVIADAVIDRLMHSSLKIIIKGESYRKVKAKNLTKNQ